MIKFRYQRKDKDKKKDKIQQNVPNSNAATIKSTTNSNCPSPIVVDKLYETNNNINNITNSNNCINVNNNKLNSYDNKTALINAVVVSIFFLFINILFFTSRLNLKSNI